MTIVADELATMLREELGRPSLPEATALAKAIVAARGDTVAAVLFYGSCLRDATAEGILDFYVLVDDYRSYHAGQPAAVFNRLLPPTVSLYSVGAGPDVLRGKVAVISRDQFAHRMRPESLDVTLWSRFCQPAALVHARDSEVAEWVAQILDRAVATAALWAARLGPDTGTAEEYWLALFRHTYRAELRAETRQDRAKVIYDAAAQRYERLLPPALARAGVSIDHDSSGRLRPLLSGRRATWRLRRVTGKLLTVARLAKASFTFANGADYIAWKIERHSGRKLNLAPWQRNHPLLAAPRILWRLWREGAVR